MLLHTVLACVLVPVASRSWNDIPTIHSLKVTVRSIPTEIDALFNSAPPTVQPTTAEPSLPPSSAPTAEIHPTHQPSISLSPTPSPTTASPTSGPTFTPTATPSTAQPTRDPFPENPPPSNPPLHYFNYDTSPGANYGPGYPETVQHNATTQAMKFVNLGWKTRWQAGPDWYWHEFDDGEFSNPTDTYYGYLSFRNPAQWNFCAEIGQQSPIDVRNNGALCEEYHQIRPDRGAVAFNELDLRIEPNLLRVVFPRRPCADDIESEGCTYPEPPGADLPHWWDGKADAIHIDFKIKSEHLLYGKQYDMEMQIWHFHHFKRRSPVMSIMVEAVPGGGNGSFQRLMLLFQNKFLSNLNACRRFRRSLEEVGETVDHLEDPEDYRHLEQAGSFMDEEFRGYSTYGDEQQTDEEHRDLQGDFFNPYHRDFVRSIYFYGYEGSMTEPPCGQWVSWRVIDTPMTLSYTQLFMTQNILFNNVSPTCERTSVHKDRSSTRPIQDTFARPVHQCTSYDYASDVEKGQRPWSPHFI